MASVKVPQASGEISVSYAGDEPIVYPVKNHRVDVEDRHLADFVAAVAGAETKAEIPPTE